jgi:hypothetical protein
MSGDLELQDLDALMIELMRANARELNRLLAQFRPKPEPTEVKAWVGLWNCPTCGDYRLASETTCHHDGTARKQ